MTNDSLSHRRGTIARAAVLAIFTVSLAGSPAVRGADVYSPRPADEVRAELDRWLARHGVKDEAVLSRIKEVWGNAASLSGRETFDRLIQSFALADREIKRFVDGCSPEAAKSTAKGDSAIRDDSDEFAGANLRLYSARSLTQRLMYDEALDVFRRIDPARVVDPATCLFYQAVCQHQLLMKKEALETLDKLLHKTQGVSESYTRVASLMNDDLEPLEERTLGSVSRKMKDSERRLDLGRGGQRVQKVQEEIVEVLDEIIKKAEKQASNSQSSAGQSNSNRSDGPASDSTIKGATAPGNVDKKVLKKQGSWGTLPAKEQQHAGQRLDRDFPSNYRQAVEEYFKKLANKPGSKGQ